MDELALLMDWDLQATMKDSTTEQTPPPTNLHLNSYPHYFCSQHQDLFSFNFQELSETTSDFFDELEELYKPFYHPAGNNPISIATTSLLHIPDDEEQVKVLKPKPVADNNKVSTQDSKEPAVASKCKRRKKNQKKRVKEVTEAEAFSDGWAWRKYGQKAIKGSPYPRSYYRCSSCKGCLCRKQVERNHLDPKVFIVTYTAEHNHPQPTRRKQYYSSSQGGTNCKNNNSSAIAASSRTVEDKSAAAEQSSNKGVEKEDATDGGDNKLFESIELEEELKWLELDGCGFMIMDTFDDDTWFNSSTDLT